MLCFADVISLDFGIKFVIVCFCLAACILGR